MDNKTEARADNRVGRGLRTFLIAGIVGVVIGCVFWSLVIEMWPHLARFIIGGEESIVGRTLDDVTTVTLDGTPWRLTDYRGKVVLIEFWATWCGPCRRMTPRLKNLYQVYGHRPDVIMVGVSVDDDVREVRSYVTRSGIEWTQLHDRGWENSLARALNVHTVPFLCLIGRDGSVRGVGQSLEDIEQELARALAK